MNAADRRVQRLAQAAQVGDLVVERAEQLLEARLAIAGARNPAERRHAWDTLTMCEANLRRSLAAYRSVRD